MQTEGLCYARLAKAAAYARDRSRPFIGTNPDANWPAGCAPPQWLRAAVVCFTPYPHPPTHKRACPCQTQNGHVLLMPPPLPATHCKHANTRALPRLPPRRLTELLPAGGCNVRYVSYAAEREPDAVVGKPSGDLARLVAAVYGLRPEATLMVGDRCVRTEVGMGWRKGTGQGGWVSARTLSRDGRGCPAQGRTRLWRLTTR
jgi:hypothetical protein